MTAGIGLSIGFLVMIVLGFWLHKELKRRKQAKVKKQFFRKNGGLLLEQQISFNKGSVADTQVFTIEELEKATDNFNVGRILGKGGLGTVYKGMLPDGSIVALKKPNQLNEKEIDQFINEIFILSQINHRNIVKVLGCCLEVQIPMVVYEYDRTFEILDKQIVEEGEEEEIMAVVKIARKFSPVRSMGDEYYCSFSHSFETCAAMEDSSEESIYSVDAASSFLK
nr:Wall-associated receptor kinase 5 [Ipomoea batatas]